MEKTFSPLSKAIIRASGNLATQFKSESIEPEHLLLAVIDESLRNPVGAASILTVFKQLRVDLFSLIEDIERSFDHSKTASADDRMPLSKETEKILKLTYMEAEILRSEFIDAEHVLLSYIRNHSVFSESILTLRYNVTYQNVQEVIKQLN